MSKDVFQMNNTSKYIGLIKFDPTVINSIPDNEVDYYLLKIWVQEVGKIWSLKKDNKILTQTIDRHLDLFLNNQDLIISLIEIKNSAPRIHLVTSYLEKLPENILEICISHEPILVSKVIIGGRISKNIIEIVVNKEPSHLVNEENLEACKKILNQYPELLYKIIDKNVNFAKHFPNNLLTNEVILYSIKQSIEYYFFRNFSFLAHLETKSEAIIYLKKKQIILSDL